MTAAYNEIDPFAAAWLRELIKRGLIAPGVVIEDSIEDLHPNDLKSFSQVHLFAGIGGWSLALRRAGWPDDRSIWTGSCPCQPFSTAGRNLGFNDERHLWPAFDHLIGQCRPPIVIGEQVAGTTGLAWLDLVQTDLAAKGYAIGAADLCAAGVGAPHLRQRLWWVAKTLADPNSEGLERGTRKHTIRERQAPQRGRGWTDTGVTPGPVNGWWGDADWIRCRDGLWRSVEPGALPLAHGVPGRVGRLRGYGNAIVVPLAEAWIRAALYDGLTEGLDWGKVGTPDP